MQLVRTGGNNPCHPQASLANSDLPRLRRFCIDTYRLPGYTGLKTGEKHIE